MHALAVPAEEQLIGTKEDSLRSGQGLPYISEVPVLFGDLVEKAYVVQNAPCIGFHVAKGPVASHPQSAVVIEGQRADRIAASGRFSPGDAIVLNQISAGDADVHYPAPILADGPDLTERSEFLIAVTLDEGKADLGALLRGVGFRRGAARLSECQGGQSQGNDRRQHELPRYSRELTQIDDLIRLPSMEWKPLYECQFARGELEPELNMRNEVAQGLTGVES